jgi:hypothetical protein
VQFVAVVAAPKPFGALNETEVALALMRKPIGLAHCTVLKPSAEILPLLAG